MTPPGPCSRPASGPTAVEAGGAAVEPQRARLRTRSRARPGDGACAAPPPAPRRVHSPMAPARAPRWPPASRAEGDEHREAGGRADGLKAEDPAVERRVKRADAIGAEREGEARRDLRPRPRRRPASSRDDEPRRPAPARRHAPRPGKTAASGPRSVVSQPVPHRGRSRAAREVMAPGVAACRDAS